MGHCSSPVSFFGTFGTSKSKTILMKRILLIAGALAWCTGAMAQNKVGGGRTFTYLPTMADPQEEIVRSSDYSRGGGQVVLWSDDFSGGTNGAGGVTTNAGAWTIANTNGNIWKHDMFGPAGCFSTNIAPPTTFTLANGFLLFDGDSANCTDATANPPVFNQNDWIGSIVSPAIDLSASSDVILSFDYSTRWCCSTQNISVAFSNDGGNSWSAEIPITSPAANTILSSSFALNVSTFIGGASAAHFRFTWGGPSHYYLMIDDVELLVPNNDDVVMNFAYQSYNTSSEEYGRVPLHQLDGDVLVGAEVFNFGINDQTNVNLTYTATNTTTSAQAFTGNVSAAAALVASDTISLEEEADASAMVIGKHTIDYEVQSDGDQIGGNFAGNNVKTRYLEVTNDLMSMDGLGNYGSGMQTTSSLGTASFTDNADGLMVFTFYDLKTTTYAYGLEVVLRTGTNGSVAGGAMVAAIHDTTNIFADIVDDPLIASDIYDITASDISGAVSSAATIRIYFPEPFELQANAYYAGVELFSNAEVNNVVLVDDITVPQPNYASLIYTPNDQTVYTNGNAMAIRMIITPNISVSELPGVAKVSAYPNPTSDVLNLAINAETSLDAVVRITTIDGRILIDRQDVSIAAGNSRQTVDVSGLANGMYLAQIMANGGSQTVRFTVIR